MKVLENAIIVSINNYCKKGGTPGKLVIVSHKDLPNHEKYGKQVPLFQSGDYTPARRTVDIMEDGEHWKMIGDFFSKEDIIETQAKYRAKYAVAEEGELA